MKIFLRNLFYITVLLALWILPVYGQDLKLNGAVLEKGTRARVANVEIRNVNGIYRTTSNEMGIFTIIAKVGDTLSFAKTGYMAQSIVVYSSKDLVVYLGTGTTLNQVVIEGQTKKQAMNEIRKDFKNKGSFYGGKPSFLSFIFTPITALYELVGRTPKNARRFNNYYANEMQQMQVDGFYNKSLITQYTGLTGKPLEDFMINYRPTYEQVRNWNSYDGIKWIKESYKKYTDTVKK